jgi:hypothetical protein
MKISNLISTLWKEQSLFSMYLSSVLDVFKVVWPLDNKVILEYTDVGRLSFLWTKFVNKIFSPEIHRSVEETIYFLSADGRRLGYFTLSHTVFCYSPVLLTPYHSVVSLEPAWFNITNLCILPADWTCMFPMIRRINIDYFCEQHERSFFVMYLSWLFNDAVSIKAIHCRMMGWFMNSEL